MNPNSRNPIQIQQASESDIPSLVQLMTEFYKESDFPLDVQWAADSFLSLITSPSQGRVWIAMRRGHCIGYVVLTVRYAMEHGALAGYIDDLYVEPDSRRAGVGRSLIDRLFEESREQGCKRMYVEVGEENLPARSLYSRFGMSTFSDGRIQLSGEV
ncbi:MAG: GNAT family N-acetyltransferase [Leptolyngbyaceae cyanobacterium SU_3_3]|nr:GNAT family N-acetyltransferase [Leptolyngbyaceae cyanobacterium SU_3_3]